MLGRLHAVPATADLDAISLGVLCTLIFFVGYGIGNDTTMLARFRSLSPGLALLPAVSILGSLAGSLAVAMLAGGHSPAEWLAVGSGMGYYSISSVLITGYRGTELGTIALLSNIVREMIALLGAPLLVRLFGTLAPIAAAGATAMDTTLPVISRTCGPRLVPVSIYCGHGHRLQRAVPRHAILLDVSPRRQPRSARPRPASQEQGKHRGAYHRKYAAHHYRQAARGSLDHTHLHGLGRAYGV